jgi:hypothetical protein
MFSISDFVFTAQLARSSARLCVRAFHFFGPPENVNEAGFLQLYSVACETIKVASRLDSVQDFASHSSHYFSRMVALSAYVVLRIFKSYLKDRLDLRDAEEHYFAAITLSKKRSLQHNDIDALNATMLTQLWASTHIFRRPNDNTDSLRLDVRRRLVRFPRSFLIVVIANRSCNL